MTSMPSTRGTGATSLSQETRPTPSTRPTARRSSIPASTRTAEPSSPSANGSDPKLVFTDYDAAHETYWNTTPTSRPTARTSPSWRSARTGDFDLFEVKANGTTENPIQLTDTGGDSELSPSWAPPVTTCTVPKLKGKTLKDAKTAIELAACSLGKVKGNKKGRVVDQSPAPNRNVKAGSPVDVKLAKKR